MSPTKERKKEFRTDQFQWLSMVEGQKSDELQKMELFSLLVKCKSLGVDCNMLHGYFKIDNLSCCIVSDASLFYV